MGEDAVETVRHQAMRLVRQLAAGFLCLSVTWAAHALVIIEPPPAVQSIDTVVNDSILVRGGATLDILPGGVVTGRVEAANNSTVNLLGGTISNLFFDNFGGPGAAPVFNIFSGMVGPFGSSRLFGVGGELNIFGGVLDGGWIVDDTNVLIAGGTTTGSVGAADGSRVRITGGTMAELLGGPTVDFQITGGDIGSLEFFDGTALVSGGKLTSLFVGSRAIATIVGFNLALVFDPIGPFPQTGLVTGTLADGTSLGTGLSFAMFSNFGARIDLINLSVPEPTTIALLAFGLTGLGFAKRRLH